ncbi:hypothetical protein [Sulfitobacter pacificus]|uniref:hypothetical protein n=1 Tax=Sulfitobacter pacificus TaxID=1499314 RepID=UPI00310592F9
MTHPEPQAYEETEIIWRGIVLTIRYAPNWCATVGMGHIEVISDARQVSPITQTGYKSHFIHAEQVSQFGSAAQYVVAWLEQEAKAESWKRHEAEARQLSLF